jgi:hypothetical protein
LVATAAVQKLIAFWHRYENVNLKIAFVLISLQLIHLYWLTADVVLKRFTGDSVFALSGNSALFVLFIAIDYIEIPALVAGLAYYSLGVYKRQKSARKDAALLVMLAVQVFHIFWLTDDVVYDTFFGVPGETVEIPYFAAWIAILIDYLELPVIADLFYRAIVRGK